MTLSFLVRPFQTPNVAPGQSIPSVTTIGAPVVVRISGQGSAAVFDWSEDYSSQQQIFGKNKEVKRKVSAQTFQNPQNEDEYAVGVVANTHTFAAENDA